MIPSPRPCAPSSVSPTGSSWSGHGSGAEAGGLGRLEVTLGVGLQLEVLDGADSQLAPWLAREGMELRVRAPSPPDPARTELARRLGKRFLGATPESVAALRAAALGGQQRSYEQILEHHDREGFDLWHSRDGAQQGHHGQLRLGFRCNQDCWFCWQGRDWPDAPGDDRARIDRLGDLGVTSLVITGGEPTAFRTLPALVAHARDRGMEVSLQTNAIGFSTPRLLGRLVEAGLSTAFVSFHSADPEVSDRMTRAPGTWARTVAGVEAALRVGLRLRLNCVVERDNLPGLAEQLVAAGVPVELLGSCGFPLCVVDEVPGLRESAPSLDLREVHMVSRSGAAVCADCGVADRCPGPRSEYLAVHGERGLRALSVVEPPG